MIFFAGSSFASILYATTRTESAVELAAIADFESGGGAALKRGDEAPTAARVKMKNNRNCRIKPPCEFPATRAQGLGPDARGAVASIGYVEARRKVQSRR